MAKAHSSAAHVDVVGGKVCLGKNEAKEDSRNLQMADYVSKKTLLPKVPSAVRYSKVLKKHAYPFPMYGNDTLPDCTTAAVGHAERVFSYNAGQPEDPTEQDVLAIFDATGPRNDGRYCLDILNYWRTVGFGADKEKIGAFVQVNPKHRVEVEAAIWLFGGVYTGFALPNSAQSQERWTVQRGPNGEAGSWGGHCVFLPDYTKMRGPTCITWGRLIEMSFGFWSAYCDEAYAILSPDWVDGSRKAPSGFDLKSLTADLAEVTK